MNMMVSPVTKIPGSVTGAVGTSHATASHNETNDLLRQIRNQLGTSRRVSANEIIDALGDAMGKRVILDYGGGR